MLRDPLAQCLYELLVFRCLAEIGKGLLDGFVGEPGDDHLAGFADDRAGSLCARTRQLGLVHCCHACFLASTVVHVFQYEEESKGEGSFLISCRPLQVAECYAKMVRFKVRSTTGSQMPCPLPDLTAIRPPQNRYLLVEFIFPEDAAKPNMTEGLLHTIIRDSLAANFGEVGWGQVGSSLNSMRIILVKLA